MSSERERPPQAPPHVLVIGGGLGGLCLAQGLMTAGLHPALVDNVLTGTGWVHRSPRLPP